ncbi:MAG TPA: GNAT family N-acetyltransferase [Pyrinomonadaceae bacterium]|nr:GNAT family N-acetyltransferase [Pyrinomonadaceae bacterium]
MKDSTQIFSDLALARRLERTEARANASFVEARARAFPESNATWLEVCGVYAMFDGVDSPLTQTFGLGLFDPVSPKDLDRIESFFEDRGAPVFHEVSPLADPAIVPLLNQRHYQPCELTTTLFREIQPGVSFAELRNDNIRVRLIGKDEVESWAQTSSRGWSEFPELADFMLMFGQVVARREDGLSFLAELDGKPIATGAMSIYDGVAQLAGASTIPEGRKQGAQLALLDSRLRYAAEHGCDIATMGALPGSASQRNAERQGFRIAYTRTKWVLTEMGR